MSTRNVCRNHILVHTYSKNILKNYINLIDFTNIQTKYVSGVI